MSDAVKDAVKDRVVAILAEQAVLEPGDVRLDATLEDLGIDFARPRRGGLRDRGSLRRPGAVQRQRSAEVRVRHQHRRDHGARRGEPDRGPEVVACAACGHHRPGHDQRPRPERGRDHGRDARGPLRHRPARVPGRRAAVDRHRRPDPRLPARGPFRPPGADALRPVHPVRAHRRARGDGAVGARDHRGARASARASCSAPRAAGCRPRTRTTGWSTRRARTGCIPSWCRG